jgi:hypothetical protein
MGDEQKWVRSDEIRTKLRAILDDMEQHQDSHYEVRRYDRPVAMLVPVGWYGQARAALPMAEARGFSGTRR